MSRHLSIAIVLALVCARAIGQPSYNFRNYDEKDGLAQRYVTNILQGDDGFIWIGTWNGLDRFDGYEFVNFKPQPGDGTDVVSDRIVSIWKNSNGNLWCLMDNSVYQFDTKSYKYSSVLDSLESESGRTFNVYDVWPQKDGTTAILCRDSTCILLEDSAPRSSARIDGHTASKYFPPQNDTPGVTVPDSDPSKTLFCLRDEGGNLWFKSHYGLYIATPAEFIGKTFPQEGNSSVRYCTRDRSGRLWVSNKEDKTIRLFDSSDNLIGYIDRSGHIVPYHASIGASVYTILEDSRGTFWLGCKPEGLLRLSEEGGLFRISSYLPDPDDSTENANAIFDVEEDPKGRIWAAIFDKGACLVEEKPDGTFSMKGAWNGLGGYPIENFNMARTIMFTENGVMLVCTTAGLLVADARVDDISKMKFTTHVRDPHRESSLSNNATMYAATDSKGRIYVCTESGGMCEILSEDLLSDELQFRHFIPSNGFPTDIVLSVIENGEDLWAIGNDKLVKVSPSRDEFLSFDADLIRKNARFSDAIPARLSDGTFLVGLQDGAVSIDLDHLKKSSFVPKLAITGISIQQREVSRDAKFSDTIVLSPPDRNITVHFAALDYFSNDNLMYAFRLNGGAWNRIGKDHSATLIDLKPGRYTLEIRSTNHSGVWVDNTSSLGIVVKPTFWESTPAKIMYALLGLLFIYIMYGTVKYIRTIRTRNNNLEAYLKILETRQENGTEEEKEIAEMQILEKAQIKAAENVLMRRVVSFVEKNISNPDIGIDDMADAAAVSRSSLTRKMKEILGITPIDFLREVRIQKACQLLKESDRNVNDVAYECGFSDPKYFSRSFKSKMGVSPSEYKSAQN